MYKDQQTIIQSCKSVYCEERGYGMLWYVYSYISSLKAILWSKFQNLVINTYIKVKYKYIFVGKYYIADVTFSTVLWLMMQRRLVWVQIEVRINICKIQKLLS